MTVRNYARAQLACVLVSPEDSEVPCPLVYVHTSNCDSTAQKIPRLLVLFFNKDVTTNNIKSNRNSGSWFSTPVAMLQQVVNFCVSVHRRRTGKGHRHKVTWPRKMEWSSPAWAEKKAAGRRRAAASAPPAVLWASRILPRATRGKLRKPWVKFYIHEPQGRGFYIKQ